MNKDENKTDAYSSLAYLAVGILTGKLLTHMYNKTVLIGVAILGWCVGNFQYWEIIYNKIPTTFNTNHFIGGVALGIVITVFIITDILGVFKGE